MCLLPTAGGDSEHQIRRFYETYGDRLCEPSHISLFRLGRKPVPLREHLLAQDAIYVGGGSMVNLLAIWRAQGLDAILREAWEAGVVLAGLSAGSMCWFEWGVTTSSGAPATAPGLGFLAGSNSVHHDSEPAPAPGLPRGRPQRRDPAGLGGRRRRRADLPRHALDEVVTRPRRRARAYEVTAGASGRSRPARSPRRPRPAHDPRGRRDAPPPPRPQRRRARLRQSAHCRRSPRCPRS